MSRIYTGDIPCPGCGKSGKESRRTSRDSICFRCMDDLRAYREILERTKNNKDTYVEFRVINNEIKYLSCNEDYDNLIAALKQLFISLDSPEMDKNSTGTPKIEHGNYHNNSFSIQRDYKYMWNGSEYRGNASFVIREDIAINMDSLVTAIENYSNAVYLLGKKDGGNLLKSLGRQEISPDEFIEKISRTR